MTRVCNIRLVDEVNCYVDGLIPDHVGYFYEKYGKHPPNHFFNPKFQLGSWDGKIRYFYKSGQTFVNLLEELIPSIVDLGYKININDKRTADPCSIPLIDATFFKNIINEETGEPWEMRGYQVDFINSLTQNGGGLGICGTGGGKTSMTAAIALLYEIHANKTSIIVVPDKNLTEQTREEYAFFGLDVGEYSGDRKDIKHQHVVSTWQALQNNPKIITEFDVIIVDECHGVKGQVLSKLLNETGKDIALRFGVTGTLPKAETDKMAVKISLGQVQYEIPAHELIAAGHLAKLDIEIKQLATDLKKQYDQYLVDYVTTPEQPKPLTYIKFKNSYLPEYPAEKSFLQSEQKRLEWIVENIETLRDQNKGNVFCLVDGVKFGKKLSKMIPDSKFVYGKDKVKARREVYDLFKDNDNLVVFATVHVASTGLNIKRIFNLVFIDVGKSFIRVIQTIGRGLRKAPDKDSVLVTDICSDLKYSKKHLNERIKFYKEAQYPYTKKVVDLSKCDSV